MSTNKLRVLVLICGTRPGALGPAVAGWFTETVAARAAELGAELVPVPLDLPFLDEEEHPSSGIYRNEHTREWSALVDSADAFVAVTPEYNYGMPATLKNALDYLGREWAWKPMGFVSYGHTSAGTRAVQHAKQVVTTMRLVPLGATVALRISDVIENGKVRSGEAQNNAAAGVLDELVRVSHALRPMRELTAPGVVAGPLPGSYLRPLTPADAAEVLVLQRCCWVEEALVNDTLAIPALHESLEQVRAWLDEWNALGLWRDGRLLGMIRTRETGDGHHVGRLGVAPDLRGKGAGGWLLAQAEAAAGTRRFELETGEHSDHNIAFYESQGYRTAPGGDQGTVRLVKETASAA